MRVFLCDDEEDHKALLHFNHSHCLVLHSSAAHSGCIGNDDRTIVIIGRSGTASRGLALVQEHASDSALAIAIVRASDEYTPNSMNIEKLRRRSKSGYDDDVQDSSNRSRSFSEGSRPDGSEKRASVRNVGVPGLWLQLYFRHQANAIIDEWWNLSTISTYNDRLPMTFVIPLETPLTYLLLNLTISPSKDLHPNSNLFRALCLQPEDADQSTNKENKKPETEGREEAVERIKDEVKADVLTTNSSHPQSTSAQSQDANASVGKESTQSEAFKQFKKSTNMASEENKSMTDTLNKMHIQH